VSIFPDEKLFSAFKRPAAIVYLASARRGSAPLFENSLTIPFIEATPRELHQQPSVNIPKTWDVILTREQH